MIKKVFLLLTTVSILFPLFAQKKKEINYVREIDIEIHNENFYAVLYLARDLEKKSPDETKHLYHKTLAEHFTIKRGQSLDTLLSFEETYGRKDKFYNYWLGRIYMLRYDFPNARKRLTAFKAMKAYKSKIILDEVNFLLRWITRAEQFYSNPDDYEIEQMPKGINTAYAEISPAFFQGHDELLFASNRTEYLDEDHLDTEYSIYHSIKKDGKWSEPTVIPAFGSTPFEFTKIEIVDEHDRLYLFRPEFGGDLYYSTLDGDTWAEPKEFDSGIRNKHLESHFFINDSEDHILFISMVKGQGDIWEVKKEGDVWSTPKPINGKVNSNADEESPFMSHDGKTLYFSSNRRESIGGFDVFSSSLDEKTGQWSAPINMGFPINTMDDDLNFELTPSDQSGYFSSNRLHSYGNFDIYYFYKIDKIKITGVVTDSKTGLNIPGATVKFHPQAYDDESFTGYTDGKGAYETDIINSEKFRLEVLYKNTVIHNGTYESFIPTNSAFLTLDIPVNLPTEFAIEQDYSQLYTGAAMDDDIDIETLGSKYRLGNKAILNNIYFDLHSYQIKKESYAILDKITEIMFSSPDLKIEIGGHTDNVGSSEVNQQLSEKRANSVLQYLKSKGIAPSRMVAKGFGEEYPLASNDDEINGRELNRRIEIIALD